MTMLINPHRLAVIGGMPFSSVKLLVSGDGSDGSTSFTDESATARTLTAAGNAQVDTAQSKFGGGSILLDGTGDYVSAADSADWVFGTDPFTVECWARFAATGAAYGVFGQSGGTVPETSWRLYSTNGTNLRFQFYDTGSSPRVITATFSPSTGQWYHFAADRNASGLMRIYIDGAVSASGTFAQSVRDGTNQLRIGHNQGANTYFNGWIDEFRVVKGYAVYNGAFTPPSAAFPRS